MTNQRAVNNEFSLDRLGYHTLSVPVDGGSLTVGLFGGDRTSTKPTLLVSHGITSNHLAFIALAQELASEFRLVVPDHRGRGASNTIVGPWGMKQHARDLAAIMEAMNLESVPLHIGHSMGAFIGVVTKAMFPEKIRRLLLVDGGLPLTDTLPTNITPEQLIEAVVGPAMQRLDMSFASQQAYFDYWLAHPALGAHWDDALEMHFAYDLQGEEGNLRSKVNKAAIVGDTQSQLMSDDVGQALNLITAPLHFLRATKGVMNGAPLYSDARIDELKARYSNLQVMDLHDVNHYTIGMITQGAKQVAESVRELLA